MLEAFMQSDLAVGLVAASLVASGMYLLRQVPVSLFHLLDRQLTVEVLVSNDDPAFDWLSRWLAGQPYAAQARRLRLTGHYNDDKREDEWRLSPGLGPHLFRHGGRWVYLSRNRHEGGAKGTAALREDMVVKMLGRSQERLRGLVEEARHFYSESDTVPIYLWRGYWNRTVRKTVRPIDSVILAEGQVERIMGDLEWFANAREWYAERGIPYRRGYLLEGPPGTGKTSLVLAAASATGRPVAVLNLGSVNGDDALFEATATAPANAIVLLEDIDCADATASRSREACNAAPMAQGEPAEPGPPQGGGVSKAALLNVLDGIGTPEGRIFVMTTNHPEKLDAALVRPGRADVRERLDLFGAPEQRRMFQRFYGAPYGHWCGRRVSPAEMQAAFMRYPKSATRARLSLQNRT